MWPSSPGPSQTPNQPTTTKKQDSMSCRVILQSNYGRERFMAGSHLLFSSKTRFLLRITSFSWYQSCIIKDTRFLEMNLCFISSRWRKALLFLFSLFACDDAVFPPDFACLEPFFFICSLSEKAYFSLKTRIEDGIFCHICLSSVFWSCFGYDFMLRVAVTATDTSYVKHQERRERLEHSSCRGSKVLSFHF